MLGALVACCARIASPQAPAPIVRDVLPPAGVAGATVRLTLTGKDIEQASSLVFSAPGFHATLYQPPPEAAGADEKKTEERKRGRRRNRDGGEPATVQWDVAIDADVATGLHDVRAVTPGGLSAPRTLHVSSVPLSAVKDPERGQPAAVEVPCRIAGLVEEGDVERFTWKAPSAGRIVVEAFGERIDSRLDPTLEVKSAGGRRVAFARDTIGLDPVLAFDARAGEEYTIELWDFTFRGSYPYVLTVDASPRVLIAYPPAVVPGAACRVTLLGWSLPGGTAPEPGSSLEALAIELRPQAATAPVLLAHRRTADLVDRLALAAAPGLQSSPIVFSAADSPPRLEAEPNDTAAGACAIDAPADICGRFDRPGDRDWFRFAAKKGEALEIEVVSSRVGAPTDTVLLVARGEEKDGKASVRDLLYVDARRSGFPREDGFERKLVPPSRDAVASWEAPDDGQYLLLLRSRNGRGGPECVYHLALRRPRPDFSLVVTHAENFSGEAPVLHAGSSQSFDAMIDRASAFKGAVKVTALDLPPGVSCAPCYIGPGESFAPLVVTAAPDAPAFDGVVRVVGEAEWEGQRIERPAASSVTVFGGSESRHPLQYVYSRLTGGLALAVRGAAPFAVQLEPADLTLSPGAKAKLTAKVRRAEGFSDAVQLALQGLGERANADDNGNRPAKMTLEKDKTETAIEIDSRNDAPYGDRTVVVYGTAQVEHVENPADPKSRKQKRRLTLVSNPVTVRLVSPVKVEVPDIAAATLPAGGALKIPFSIERRPGVEGEVEVSLDVPKGAKGYAAETVKLAKDATGGELVLTSEVDGPAGSLEGLRVRARVQVNGRGFEEKARCPFTVQRVEPLRIASATAPPAVCRGGGLAVSFRLERIGGAGGKVAVSLQAPKGAEALQARLELEADKTEGVIDLPLGTAVGSGSLDGLRLEAALEKGGKRFAVAVPLTAVKLVPALSLAGPIESARVGVWRVPLRRDAALEPGRELKLRLAFARKDGSTLLGEGTLGAGAELQAVLVDAAAQGAPPAGEAFDGLKLTATLILAAGELVEELQPAAPARR